MVQQVIQAREGMDYNEQEKFQDDEEDLISGNEKVESVITLITHKEEEKGALTKVKLTNNGKMISTLMTKQKSKTEVEEDLSLGMSDSGESEDVSIK